MLLGLLHWLILLLLIAFFVRSVRIVGIVLWVVRASVGAGKVIWDALLLIVVVRIIHILIYVIGRGNVNCLWVKVGAAGESFVRALVLAAAEIGAAPCVFIAVLTLFLITLIVTEAATVLANLLATLKQGCALISCVAGLGVACEATTSHRLSRSRR